VTGLERPRRGLDLELHVDELADRHRRRPLPRIAVREVQHVARDERRGTVGEDVADLRRQIGDRLARGDAHPHPRVTEDLELPLERRPRVREGVQLVRGWSSG
jgi:hypothetical protein